jgi:hyperosmotically inducible periplasmic protein
MKTRLAPSLVCAIALIGVVSLLAGNRVAAAPQQADAAVQREVMHELRMLNNYTVFDDIKFSVEGGEVTLSGEVVNAVLKSDAEAELKGVQGVSHVTNNIKVLPLSGGDQEIRRAEYRSIYGEAQLSKYGWQSVQAIHIIVENGHVTLEGVVDNTGDKNLAVIRAKSVPGTFGVVDNLQVQGPR